MSDLRLGDCLDILPAIASGSVDLTVTSPPYDNLRTYNGSLNDWTEAKWKAIIAELLRVTKTGGVVVWVVGDATVNGSETGTSFRQALHAMECGLRLHDTMVYQKAGTGACGSNLAYLQSFEYMFVFSKGRPQAINRIADHPNSCAGSVRSLGRKNVNGGTKDTNRRVIPDYSVRSNVWRYGAGGYSFGHPAKFPDALARDHILSWSNEGDTVLDPFLGSGTTGKMALQLSRRFIGIERDPEYFAIAQRRIAQATQQSTLLLEAAG